MEEYSPPNKDANQPLELFNLTKIKDPAAMGTWIKENWHRIPPSIVDQLGLWYRRAAELDFKPYCKAMRDDFRRLARRHPELPLDVLISWIKATPDGFPARVIVDLWLSELVSMRAGPRLKSPSCSKYIAARSAVW
jgi:hypothetical protein